MMQDRLFRSLSRAALGLLGLTLLAGRAGAQAEPIFAEAYRLRIENALFGRVEISVDGGEKYALIGRVLRPATATSAEKVATTPGIVLRGGSGGFAFSTASGRTLALRPRPGSATVKSRRGKPQRKVALPPPDAPTAIQTDLEAGKGIFSDLMPSFRNPARLQTGPDYLAAFHEGYTPSFEDVIVIQASLAAVNDADADAKEKLRQRIEAMQKAYAAGAVGRAQSAKRVIITGMLTLRANLPAGEPEPIVGVNYSVDGKVIAIQNQPPFTHDWDTREVADGEHVIEITASNGRGGVVTRARALVVVQNDSPAP